MNETLARARLRLLARRGAILLALAIAVCSRPASADSYVVPASYALSLRPAVGLGGGNVGVGARLGASTEYWFSDAVGVGFQGATFAQGQLFGPDSSGFTLGPLLVFRGLSGPGHLVAEVGGGWGHIQHTGATGLCIFSKCNPSVTEYVGSALDLAAGWIGHPSGSRYEVGPVARFDAVFAAKAKQSIDYVVTMNLELGLVLR